MQPQYNCFKPFIGPFDPCPPVTVKCYSTPPHLFMGFQPPNLPQFNPYDALRYGTLWPDLFSPYDPQSWGADV